MTKKVRESKAHLNKEHSTLLEAFQTIYNSGLVKFVASVLLIGGTLVWRVEVMSMKVSDLSDDVKNHGDTLRAHTLGVWHRPPVRDTFYALTIPKRSQLTDREREYEEYYDKK